MSILVLNQIVNPNIPASLVAPGPRVMSGVLECVFRGTSDVDVTRDILAFKVGRVNLGTGGLPAAACVMSPASLFFDGPVNSVLWAVDGARVTGFTDEDRGSGTANLNVEGNLAVRGLNGMLLRVNYIVFSY
jgi:hypothetical protein